MTLTIAVAQADEHRVTEAFGDILGLGRPALEEEINGALSTWVNDQTQDHERRQNMQAFTPPGLGLVPPPHSQGGGPAKPAPETI